IFALVDSFDAATCTAQGFRTSILNEYTLRLEFKAETTVSGLRVSYFLITDSQTAVGVFNRLMAVASDGTRNFSPENIYIELENSELHLRKMALTPPEGLQMTVRPLPHESRLENKSFQH